MIFVPFILTDDGPRLGGYVSCICQLGLSTMILCGFNMGLSKFDLKKES